MRKHAYFYICAALLASLWIAEKAFEGWADTRSRARPIPLRGPLSDIPFIIRQWHGRSVELEGAIVRVAGADQFISRNYRNPDGQSVGLYITYYGGLYRVIPHGPGTCYPMGGWKTTHTRTVNDKTGTPAHYLFFFEKELDKQAVIYWYYVNGTRLAGTSWARFRFATDLLRGSGGSIIQVQLATDVSGDGKEALDALNDFSRALGPVLAEVLPQPDDKTGNEKGGR